MDSSNSPIEQLEQESESSLSNNESLNQNRIPKWLIGLGKLLLGLIGILFYYSIKYFKTSQSPLHNIFLSIGLIIIGLLLFYNGYRGYMEGELPFVPVLQWQVNFWKLNTRQLSIISIVSGILSFLLGFSGVVQILFRSV